MVFMFLYSGLLLLACSLIFVKILAMWAGEIGKRPRYLLMEKEREGKINIFEKIVLRAGEYLREGDEDE